MNILDKKPLRGIDGFKPIAKYFIYLLFAGAFIVGCDKDPEPTPTPKKKESTLAVDDSKKADRYLIPGHKDYGQRDVSKYVKDVPKKATLTYKLAQDVKGVSLSGSVLKAGSDASLGAAVVSISHKATSSYKEKLVTVTFTIKGAFKTVGKKDPTEIEIPADDAAAVEKDLHELFTNSTLKEGASPELAFSVKGGDKKGITIEKTTAKIKITKEAEAGNVTIVATQPKSDEYEGGTTEAVITLKSAALKESTLALADDASKNQVVIGESLDLSTLYKDLPAGVTVKYETTPAVLPAGITLINGSLGVATNYHYDVTASNVIEVKISHDATKEYNAKALSSVSLKIIPSAPTLSSAYIPSLLGDKVYVEFSKVVQAKAGTGDLKDRFKVSYGGVGKTVNDVKFVGLTASESTLLVLTIAESVADKDVVVKVSYAKGDDAATKLVAKALLDSDQRAVEDFTDKDVTNNFGVATDGPKLVSAELSARDEIKLTFDQAIRFGTKGADFQVLSNQGGKIFKLFLKKKGASGNAVAIFPPTNDDFSVSASKLTLSNNRFVPEFKINGKTLTLTDSRYKSEELRQVFVPGDEVKIAYDSAFAAGYSGTKPYLLAVGSDGSNGRVNTFIPDTDDPFTVTNNLKSAMISRVTYDKNTGLMVISGTDLPVVVLSEELGDPKDFATIQKSIQRINLEYDFSKIELEGASATKTTVQTVFDKVLEQYIATTGKTLEIDLGESDFKSSTSLSIKVTGESKKLLDAEFDKDGTQSSKGTAYNAKALAGWLRRDITAKDETNPVEVGSSTAAFAYQYDNSGKDYLSESVDASDDNNGKVLGKVLVTLTGTSQFNAVTGNTFVAGTHYSVAGNVPAGLMLKVNRTGNSTAEILFEGKATAHEKINSISDTKGFGIVWKSAALESNPDLSKVPSATWGKLEIKFVDKYTANAPAISEVTYNVTSGDLVITGTNLPTENINFSKVKFGYNDLLYPVLDVNAFAKKTSTTHTAMKHTYTVNETLNKPYMEYSLSSLFDKAGKSSYSSKEYKVWFAGAAFSDASNYPSVSSEITVSNLVTPDFVKLSGFESKDLTLGLFGASLPAAAYAKGATKADMIAAIKAVYDLSKITLKGEADIVLETLLTEANLESLNAGLLLDPTGTPTPPARTAFVIHFSQAAKTQLLTVFDKAGPTSSGNKAYSVEIAAGAFKAYPTKDPTDASGTVAVPVVGSIPAFQVTSGPTVSTVEYDYTARTLTITGQDLPEVDKLSDLKALEATSPAVAFDGLYDELAKVYGLGSATFANGDPTPKTVTLKQVFDKAKESALAGKYDIDISGVTSTDRSLVIKFDDTDVETKQLLEGLLNENQADANSSKFKLQLAKGFFKHALLQPADGSPTEIKVVVSNKS